MLKFFVRTWQRSRRNAFYQLVCSLFHDAIKIAGVVYAYVWAGKLLDIVLNPTIKVLMQTCFVVPQPVLPSWINSMHAVSPRTSNAGKSFSNVSRL